ISGKSTMNSEDVWAEEPEPASMARQPATMVPANPPESASHSADPRFAKFPPGNGASLAPPATASSVSAAPAIARRIEPINRAVVSERSRRFLRRHFPGVSIHDWNDWKWQVRNRIRRLDSLERIIALSDDERASVLQRTGNLPIAITPYYLSLISPDDPMQPL